MAKRARKSVVVVTVKPKHKGRKPLFVNMRAAIRAYHKKIEELGEKEERIISLVTHVDELTVPPFMWRTKEGVKILPKDMEESHLRNTISFLQRTLVYSFGTKTWVSSTMFQVEALSEMMKEAKRRGLQF